ncbi:MAG: hypothetical protein HN413_01815 [Chloroflexi bacterium]|jgi:hypothetical protein|nr:hypothetical protein [Chloroflexota bacterium]
MNAMISWIRAHKFEAHLTAFLLMVVPSALLYFSNQAENAGPIWVFLGIFVVGNILAMVIK